MNLYFSRAAVYSCAVQTLVGKAVELRESPSGSRSTQQVAGACHWL